MGHRGASSSILHYQHRSTKAVSQGFQQSRLLLLAWVRIQPWANLSSLLQSTRWRMDCRRKDQAKSSSWETILQDQRDTCKRDEIFKDNNSKEFRRQEHIFKSDLVGIRQRSSSLDWSLENLLIVCQTDLNRKIVEAGTGSDQDNESIAIVVKKYSQQAKLVDAKDARIDSTAG